MRPLRIRAAGATQQRDRQTPRARRATCGDVCRRPEDRHTRPARGLQGRQQRDALPPRVEGNGGEEATREAAEGDAPVHAVDDVAQGARIAVELALDDVARAECGAVCRDLAVSVVEGAVAEEAPAVLVRPKEVVQVGGLRGKGGGSKGKRGRGCVGRCCS